MGSRRFLLRVVLSALLIGYVVINVVPGFGLAMETLPDWLQWVVVFAVLGCVACELYLSLFRSADEPQS